MSKQDLVQLAEQSLDSEFRITTHQGIKTSSALYRSDYLEIKDLKERLQLWHNRIKEAVFRLGLPQYKPTDAVVIQIVGTKGSRELTLSKMQAKLAEGNPALMKFLADAKKAYNAQPVLSDKKTVKVTDNER